MGKEVSESCVDSLMVEMVSAYSSRFFSGKPDLAARRIEAIGYHVGVQLSERYTMERPRFTEPLEAIKFICKDFWSELFKKQIDNLKTNHRGTFVLQDNCFRWLTRLSVDLSFESADPSQPTDPSSQIVDKSEQANSTISADSSNLPACSFVVRVKA